MVVKIFFKKSNIMFGFQLHKILIISTGYAFIKVHAEILNHFIVTAILNRAKNMESNMV